MTEKLKFKIRANEVKLRRFLNFGSFANLFCPHYHVLLFPDTPPQGGSNYLTCHKFLSYHVYGSVLIPWNRKIQRKSLYDENPLCPKDLYSDPKIQRIFNFYKGKKISTHFSTFLFLNNFLANIGCTGVIPEVQTVVQTPRLTNFTDVIFHCHMRHSS